jgi:hypothetical protein
MQRDKLMFMLVLITLAHLVSGIFFISTGNDLYLINLVAIFVNLYILGVVKVAQ